MTDDRLFERLAAHAGAADVDPGFEDRLYVLLQQEMGRSGRSARPILLLVAAVLAILAISAAVAVGSGLIDLPWLDDDSSDNLFHLAGPTSRCDQTLADGVLLTAVPLHGSEWPTATQLTVYEDGLVVTGFPPDWGAPPTVGLDGIWSQRRLTAEGVAALKDAVTSSGLPNCQSFEFDGGMAIRARLGAGVFSIGLGPDNFETRPTTPAQATAASDLAERLRDPNLGLSASSWGDDQWHPYLPERWRFLLQFSGPQDVAYPSSDGVVLPDGSTLQTFGLEEPAADTGWTMVRCGATDSEDAHAIAAMLTEAGAGPTEGSLDTAWHFTDGPNTAEVFHNTITVNVVGLLPHEPDCTGGVVGGVQPEEPPSSPSTDPAAPFTDACDYMPTSIVGDVIGPLDGPSEHYPEWSADWAFCWYPVSQDGLMVFSSRQPFPGARASDQAISLFGEGNFTVEQIAGRDVFSNGCLSGGPCRTAIAIPAEPHFVVINWQAEALPTLRQLAERLIQELDAAD